MRKSQGFTLIELLIVIALIAVLAGAVVIALNPARQFQQARDSERWSHVSAIAQSITNNITENRGVWTCTVSSTPVTLPTTSTLLSSTGGVNICSCLVPNYTAALPSDPSGGSYHYNDCFDYNTGYYVMQNATSGRITVSSTGEITTNISVTQ